MSLHKARAKKQKVDWAKTKIVKPSFLGTKVFTEYDLSKLVEFFDWDPFFQSW